MDQPRAGSTATAERVPLRERIDATSFLSVFVIVVFLIPAGFVIGFLGSAGRPAMLLGFFAFVWWAHETLLARGSAARGPQPIRRYGLIFLAAVLISAINAWLGPIIGVEGRAADRGLIMVACLLGLTFLAADGIKSRERLDTLLQRLTTAGSVLASVGILQFFVSFDLESIVTFPGLTPLGGFQEIQVRSDLSRVAATASHPIEFGVVLALLLPLALHFALYAKSRQKLAWLRVGLIAAAIPLSIGRSGTLAMFIAFFAMWCTWPRRLRIRSLVIAAIGTVGMRLLIPGLIGTIRSLFTNILYDPSTQGRTEDYARVGEFISERPLFGRGFFTFLPDRYFWLDNQYLGLLIETGIVGTAAFVLLFGVGIRTAWRARQGADDETRSLGQALLAALLAILLSAGTFDMLSFTMVSGVSFLLLGSAGALWRLQRIENAEPASADRFGPPPHDDLLALLALDELERSSVERSRALNQLPRALPGHRLE